MFENPDTSVAIKDACPSQCCQLDGVLSSILLCFIVSFYLPELLTKDDVILTNIVSCRGELDLQKVIDNNGNSLLNYMLFH